MPTLTFTCQDCGGHDLGVVHEYTATTHYSGRMRCICAPEADRIAVVRRFHVTVVSQESGRLHENHRWAVEEHEDVGWFGEIEDGREVYCSACAEHTRADEWEITEVAWGVDEQSHTFFVCCDGCYRDIELGFIPIQEGALEHQRGL